MKTLKLTLPLIVFCVIFSSCNKQVENTARKLLDSYEEALSSKSSETIVNMFHPDAMMTDENNSIIAGHDAFIKHFKKYEKMDFEERFEIKDLIRAGQVILLQTKSSGYWKSTEVIKDGNISRYAQFVLRKDKKKKWKIYRYSYEDIDSKNCVEMGNFYHTVYFWLKEPNNEEARKKFVNSLEEFINNSVYIKSKFIGTPSKTNRDVIDNTYTYSLILTFDSKSDHDKYQKEEGHHQFIKESSELWKKVLVYDSESE